MKLKTSNTKSVVIQLFKKPEKKQFEARAILAKKNDTIQFGNLKLKTNQSHKF